MPKDSNEISQAMLEARQKMIAKRFGAGNNTATVGGARRKKKPTHKTTTADDKKLMMTLKKLGVTSIPAIEEVNMFVDNGDVIHFVNPKVQASVGSNTYVISGRPETKKLQDLLPGIVNELGAENMDSLKAMAAGAMGSSTANDDDDDVPDLVDNFEAVAQ
mmetsp:Transcript_11109/g.16570  ORF Transcript_11109/g.16570 Transcript_11109/m.16570 type:complete len:161 (+) Transcript_11109:70-552(+)